MTRRKRTTVIVLVTVAALLMIAGVAWAAGMFPDVAENDTHFDAIEWAAENGVVNGYANGNFGPYDPILRGQAATMFQNYDEYLKSTMDGTSTCSDCHNDTTLLTGKRTAWSESLHGTGEAFGRGTSASCAGCHSGGSFSAMVAAGQSPNEVTAGDPNPTRQDCRACHQIHETYTGADWALETTAPVELFAVEGATFNGGKGNLCVNCHQPRRGFPAAVNGTITGITSHWGPHHGPQSAMMLGVAGAGAEGTPSTHYLIVGDTCVGCHLGPNDGHSFEPVEAVCQTCHPDADGFDVNGVQTEVQARLDVIGAALVDLGLLSSNDVDGHPTVTEAPEAQAIALYNWIYIAHEDKSLGVHNPPYTDALLTAAEEALGL
ncbi:MAG: S-layer homology domain-containing protein [Thermoleophilia bacterium]|nr:S-layer homology domain-containing protein [Thermoleophilia bacterium]